MQLILPTPIRQIDPGGVPLIWIAELDQNKIISNYLDHLILTDTN